MIIYSSHQNTESTPCRFAAVFKMSSRLGHIKQLVAFSLKWQNKRTPPRLNGMCVQTAYYVTPRSRGTHPTCSSIVKRQSIHQESVAEQTYTLAVFEPIQIGLSIDKLLCLRRQPAIYACILTSCSVN